MAGTPACQWSFNQARRFHYIAGDAAAIFHRTPAELVRQHVSMIDDASGSWAARLDRVFTGNAGLEAEVPPAGELHTMVHVPLRGDDGQVLYAAGFAYRAGQPAPAAEELELAALATLQVVDAERARTERFLHDVVAQCLSSTGLQIELLRLDAEARGLMLPVATSEIQSSLEQALDRIRTFSPREETEAEDR
jgi:signal transduction histidine kinase